jgi:hypothetical protein
VTSFVATRDKLVATHDKLVAARLSDKGPELFFETCLRFTLRA